jgi:two-component system cell cycle response regulator
MALEHSHVLVVDDDPAILRLLDKWLSAAGYRVSLSSDGATALSAIDAACPDFLVTDWEMPGGISGLELCEHVRRSDLPHYVYTVMLTGRNDADDRILALQSGADDFTHKPVDRVELLARLKAGSRIVELERRLSQLANSDPLTGLATKRTFHEHLEREWKRARRYRTKLSCVMLDIDFFKRINDSYGHPAGDEVIRVIANVLTETCRASDYVGRVGGEEFCVVLTETDEENAVMWAERLRKRVGGIAIKFADRTLKVTISLGVAQLTDDTKNAAQLVDHADQSLLAAKHAGRDRVVCGGELLRISAACKDPANDAGAIFNGVKARDVMTTIVASLSSDATIGKAAQYFLRFRFSSAPVVNAQGKLVGFLSEKDVMNVLLWPDCWTRHISDVMKSNVVCYDEDEPILSIYEFLCRVPIRSVVIARDGKPTGVISRGTLLRWFSNLVVSRQSSGQSSDETAADDDRGQLALTAKAIARQVEEMRAVLEGDDIEDVTPHVIGGASRIQELVTDLLAGGQGAVSHGGTRMIGSCGWGPPRTESSFDESATASYVACGGTD